jgi:uncharacterized membrane protein
MGELDPLRHHRKNASLHGAFGNDRFGVLAERFARFFGTPKFILGQTCIVLLWITLNVIGLVHHWDVYPFILLNLLFSTQAAYAAPLILLAQTRQADRDKASESATAQHTQEEADRQCAQLTENTNLTREIHAVQGPQMAILERVKNVHNDLQALIGALAENGVIDGRPEGDPGLDSQPDRGEHPAGAVNLGGVPGHD